MRPVDKKNIENLKNAGSKIRIVEGSSELKERYNRDEKTIKERERSKALDELSAGRREKNEFWDEDVKESESSPDDKKEENNAKKKKLKILLMAIAGVAAIVLAVVLIKEIAYRLEIRQSVKKLEALQNMVLQAVEAENKKLNQGTTATPVPAETGTVTPTVTETPEKPTILPEYATLYSRNSDMVGWITIEGTVVNYPVMQTKSNMEYYLTRDFDGNYDICGLPFVDSRSDVLEPTTNILIYGHSMKNGTMFATLLKYKDYSYYLDHKTIKFDTVYEHAEYEIIAVFQSRVAYSNEEVFRYYRFIDTDSEDEFNDYISNVKKMSYYNTGVTANFGDSLLTLSTCDREITDGRLAIVARKINSTTK